MVAGQVRDERELGIDPHVSRPVREFCFAVVRKPRLGRFLAIEQAMRTVGDRDCRALGAGNDDEGAVEDAGERTRNTVGAADDSAAAWGAPVAPTSPWPLALKP